MKTKQMPPMPIRLPTELKEWLKAQAESNHRSVNAEITAILLAERKKQERRLKQRVEPAS